MNLLHEFREPACLLEPSRYTATGSDQPRFQKFPVCCVVKRPHAASALVWLPRSAFVAKLIRIRRGPRRTANGLVVSLACFLGVTKGVNTSLSHVSADPRWLRDFGGSCWRLPSGWKVPRGCRVVTGFLSACSGLSLPSRAPKPAPAVAGLWLFPLWDHSFTFLPSHRSYGNVVPISRASLLIQFSLKSCRSEKVDAMGGVF